MTSTKTHAAGTQASAAAISSDVGAFMLTLCPLQAPVSIRPPRAPQLARFKFFTTRSRSLDGNERLYLHMGYFSTRAEADKWAQVMRVRYPHVIATATPSGLMRQASSAAQSGSSARGQPPVEPPVVHGIAPAEAHTLTDTQVLDILETRRVQLSSLGRHPPDRPEISLLRPDDTHTRRALKAAVVQGTPVPFVVQLCRSDEPIKLAGVRALDIFRAYTLYLAEGNEGGVPWYALRLGFFSDAVSAKQVAYYARTSFAAVAVVPIDEEERTRASKKPLAMTHLAPPVERSIDDMLAADQAQSAAAEKTKPPAAPPAVPSRQNRPPAVPKSRHKDSLEQTLELLAASELWSQSDSDSFSETGVRHLKVEVQKRSSRGS